MPGFTHLQVAQPVTFGHHLLAYDAMFARDMERLTDCRKRVNRLPLGAAALAGTSYPIDRERVARELGFDGLCPNSLDVVADRDFDRIAAAATRDGAPFALRRGADPVVTALRLSQPPIASQAARSCRRRRTDVPELVRGKAGGSSAASWHSSQ